MKYAEMNVRQKKAFRNIMYAANWLIGGLENSMSDNPEGSNDWQNSNALLNDHDSLVAEIYDMAITGVYDEGFAAVNDDAYVKDIRFCGKEWLLERVEKRVTKLGY